MHHENLQAAAAALALARSSRNPCPRISERFDIQSLHDAYAVQEINTLAALAAGRRLSGRKIGLTSLAVQQQLGVDQPDFGMLFADMEYHDGATIDSARLIQPKVEGEIAFVLGRDLPHPDTTLSELLRAVDHVLPALEIVDSAIEDWKITLVDTVADNASSGLYVLGKTPVSLRGLDLALEGMLLDGQPTGRFAVAGAHHGPDRAPVAGRRRAVVWRARAHGAGGGGRQPALAPYPPG